MSQVVTKSAEDIDRTQEIERLLKAGELQALVDMLDEPSWSLRRQIAAALSSAGNAAVVPLCELLRTRRDHEGRIAAAVEALAASTSTDDAPIEALAGHTDPAVVADAAQVLGRRRDPKHVPLLVGLVGHANDNVAVAAIEALGRVGGRAAVDALLAVLEGGNFFRVFPAIEVLGRSGDPRIVRPLATLLESGFYAREAARALGRTGERQAVAPLAALLAHPTDSTVRLAAAALTDLDDRYRERYGIAGGVEEAIRSAAPGSRTVERLSHAAIGADPAEQIAICRVLGALGDQAGVPLLAKLLDAAPAVAAAAGSALKKAGRHSEEELLRALRAGDSARKQILLPLLAKSSALADVVACLGDADAIVRALACDTLARIGSTSVVPQLFPLLEDPNLRVGQAAVSAIQSLGSRETEGLATRAAASPNPIVRRAALRILSYFGYGTAYPTFATALADPDPRVRDAALQGLPFIDDPRALDAILVACRDPSGRTRAAAMRSIGQASDDPRVHAVLLKGLGDSEPWVRYYACQSLGKMSCESAAPAIVERLRDDAGQVRVAAVEALSHLQAPLADQALCAAAANDDLDVQRAALIGLGVARRSTSLPVLFQALAHPDAATRLVAVSALSSFEEQEVSQALGRAAIDPDESVRTASIGFLSSRPGSQASEILIHLLVHPANDTERAIVALTVPVEGRIPALLAALQLSDDELSPRLTSALARMHRPDARAALLEALTYPNVACRKAAATTLAAMGSRDGLAAVKRAAQQDPDPQVRQICSLLLAE